MHKHFYESINGGEPTCIDDEIPFEIPDSWEWVRGMSIFEATRNIVPQKDFSYIDIDAIDNKRHIIKSGKPTKKEKAPSRARRLLEPGDVLFSLVRPYLENIALVENQYANAIASTGFYVVRSRVLFPGFAYILFLSPYVLQGLNAFMKGDNSPSIRSENIEDFLYPIPPLSEQQEIVKAFNEVEYKLDTLQQSRQRYKRILSETPTSLRQQLVQSAIQGLLVPQNPNDEPASVLLERIAQERSVKLGKKAAKSMSRIVRRGGKTYELFPDGSEKDISDEIPFEIPENWAWVRLGNLCAKIGAGSTPKGGKAVYKENGILFLRSQNVYNNGLRLEKAAFIEPAVDKSMAGSRVESLDLLLNITGASIGRCAIVPPEIWRANVNQHVLILRCIDKSMVEFVHTCIVAPFTFKHIMALQVGATKEGLSAQNASRLLLPIPPYAEQQRIVTTLNTVLPYLAL